MTLPQLSWRFVPVLRRNLLVWRKLAGPSILGNIAEPLITLVAFGYGLGALLPQIGGVPYIVFLAAGSICMSTMTAASFEALYSAYSRMEVQRTWDTLLNAPLLLDDVLIGEWLWAAIKSCLSGCVIVLVIVALGVSRSPLLVFVPLVVVLIGLVFSAIALCVNAVAKSYDFFTYYFTLVIAPMTFLSGVYYPVDHLPRWLQVASDALPLTAAIRLVRPLVLGQVPDAILLNLAILIVYSIAALALATTLTRRRFSRR